MLKKQKKKKKKKKRTKTQKKKKRNRRRKFLENDVNLAVKEDVCFREQRRKTTKTKTHKQETKK